MSALGLATATIVVVWLILTVFMQFRILTPIVGRFDPFRFVPIWTFFAPNPGVVDYHLVVRHGLDNHQSSPWCIASMGAERHFLNFLWNPQKRQKKILIDSVQSLIQICKQPDYAGGYEVVSLPYLVLLHAARSVPPPVGTKYTQFAIVESRGHHEKNIQLSFLSRKHKWS